MDACAWDKDRFDAVVERVSDFLRSDAGWDVEEDVVFVPVSGFLGSNVVSPLGEASMRPDLGWSAPAATREVSDLSGDPGDGTDDTEGVLATGAGGSASEADAAAWYASYCEGLLGKGHSKVLTALPKDTEGRARGPTLMECIDALPSLPRSTVIEPLRLTVSDVRKEGNGNVYAAGRIASGWLQQGDSVRAPPAAGAMRVKSIKPLTVVADDSADGFAAYMESDADGSASGGGAGIEEGVSGLWGGKKVKPCALPGRYVEI